MTATPLVSIVVPCYLHTRTQGELLEETLGTVSAQTCADYEVIVVDDGSSIDVAAIAGTCSQARCVRQPNAGVAVARNTGIAQAQGQYFVFLDADDHLLPRALEAGLQAFADEPGCGFVVGPREEMTFEGDPVPWHVSPPPSQTHLYKALLGFEWYIIPPSSAMFRSTVVEALGGFLDPWGADDLDFYLRAARAFTAHCFQSPAVTRYRRYSESSSRDGERMLHSIRAVYARHSRWVQGNPELEAAYARGLQQLTSIFLDCLVENIDDRLRRGNREGALRAARVLSRESPERWNALLAQGGGAGTLLTRAEPSPIQHAAE